MKKDFTLVDCYWCKNRSVAAELYGKCSYCNDSGKVINPKEILCNLCGGCMCSQYEHAQYPLGLYNAKVIGGYESDHLLDLNSYTFNFCEKCLRELFIKCKIKPDINEVILGSNLTGQDLEEEGMSFEKDQEIYEYMVWDRNGGRHQNYIDGLCNFIKDCKNKAIYTQNLSDEFTENCCCEEHKNKSNPVNGEFVPFISNILKPFL